MRPEFEVVQVLQAASNDLDVELLIECGITYERVLLTIQEMLSAGCLEDNGVQLVLTVVGGIRLQAGIKVLAERKAQKKVAERPVYQEQQLVVDYIPPKLVD